MAGRGGGGAAATGTSGRGDGAGGSPDPGGIPLPPCNPAGLGPETRSVQLWARVLSGASSDFGGRFFQPAFPSVLPRTGCMEEGVGGGGKGKGAQSYKRSCRRRDSKQNLSSILRSGGRETVLWSLSVDCFVAIYKDCN